MTPNQAFDNDVDQLDQYQVMEDISVNAHEGIGRYDTSYGYIRIYDFIRKDAINVEASGIIEYNGKEFEFAVEDGDRNGTVLLGWNKAGRCDLEEYTPIEYKLAPTEDLVQKAITTGTGSFLLMKWDAFNDRLSDLPRKYMYDKHFAPGVKTEMFYKELVKNYGLRWVTAEEYVAIRNMLG